jgi:hypothetical protein
MPTATKIAIIAAGLMFDVRASDASTHLGAQSPRSERVLRRGIANIGRSTNACQTCSPAIAATVLLIPTKAPLQ